MLLINSIKIMFSNFGTMWKIFLYKFVMLLVFFGLFAAVVLPQIGGLIEEIGGTGLFSSFAELINYILRIEQQLGFTLSLLNDRLVLALEALSNYPIAIVCTAIIYCVYRFLNSLIDIPLTSVLDTNLVSCAKIPLMPTLFKNIKKSAKYSLWSLLITLPSAIVISISIYFSAQAVFSVFPPLAFFLIAFLIVVLFAFRSTALSMWRPVAVSGGNSILEPFKEGIRISFKRFWLLYTYYIIIYLSIVFVNIIVAVFTCGAGLIVSIPLSLLLTSIFQLVYYFSFNRKKYYLDGDTIVKARLDHSMPDLEAEETVEAESEN